MGMKKIIKQIHRYADENYELGYQAALENEAWQAEYFEEGVRTERDRIIALFNMLSNNEFENGSPNKARAWKDAAELVKVADHLEAYDEEGEYLG